VEFWEGDADVEAEGWEGEHCLLLMVSEEKERRCGRGLINDCGKGVLGLLVSGGNVGGEQLGCGNPMGDMVSAVPGRCTVHSAVPRPG